ncbi:MAG: ThiF family adenylyltransferase [Pseudomonadota bacterium]
MQVVGPDGLVEGEAHAPRDLLELFAASGALRACSPAARRRLEALYADDATSRTAAFFESVLADPAEVPQVMARLSRMRVAILGCGGIGTGIAYLLASLGVKRFLLQDGDRIERSNLNRQFLYALDDVGQLKVEVLARELKRRFEGLRIALDIHAVDPAMPRMAWVDDFGAGDHIVVSADDPPDLCFHVHGRIANPDIAVWSAGYLNGVSKVERLSGRKRARPPGTWRRIAPVSTSVGFQNFEICARLAAAIAFDAFAPGAAQYHDYRRLVPSGRASG